MRLITGLLAMAAALSAAISDKDTVRRLDESAGILSEVIDSDKGIPRDLLDRAHCAIIVPSLKKGAFVVGAQYGVGFAEQGGFVYYGPDTRAFYPRAALYVDKILRGADPATLPVEQPQKFEMVINLKTARQLGLGVPRGMLLKADRVIE